VREKKQTTSVINNLLEVAARQKKELAPDGVDIIIDWTDFKRDTSVFIPCIDVHKTALEVRRVFKARGWSLYAEARIENGKYGLRVWRID